MWLIAFCEYRTHARQSGWVAYDYPTWLTMTRDFPAYRQPGYWVRGTEET